MPELRRILHDIPGDGPTHELHVYSGADFTMYELSHVPECDQLRYGEKCHLASMFKYAELWPTERGDYHIGAWCTPESTAGGSLVDPDEGVDWWPKQDGEPLPVFAFGLQLSKPPTLEEIQALEGAGLADCMIGPDGHVIVSRRAADLSAAISSAISQVVSVPGFDVRVTDFGVSDAEGSES